MDRIVHATAVDIGGGKRGFRSKDTVAGLPGTVVTAGHMNAVQEEIMAVIEKAGLAGNGAILSQLMQAIRGQTFNFRAAGGTENALSLTLDPAPADYAALVGTPLRIVIGNSNTGAVTLNVNGLGALALVYPGDNSPLLPGELHPGQIRTAIVNGLGQALLVDAGSRARAGVSWRGMVAIAATASFNPATYGLTSIDRMLVMLWGAGGGATSQTGGAGGGGGGGGFAMKIVPAQVATVTIGVGGVGNTAGSNATAGGTTSFGSVFSVDPGAGATAGPGAGGVGVGGDINLTGSGGDDMLGSGHNFAKGGGAPLMGLTGALNFISRPVGSGGSSVYIPGTWNNADNGGNGLAIIIY